MEKQEMGTDIDAENIIENETGNDRQLICNAYYDCACMHAPMYNVHCTRFLKVKSTKIHARIVLLLCFLIHPLYACN